MDRLLPSEQVVYDVITLRSAKSDPKFGCDPHARPIDQLLNFSIINVNKPKGPSSHQVADALSKIVNVGKAGHSGTLDPAVTGVLPTAIGRATRITQALLPAGKEYVALMLLHEDVSEQKVRDEFKQMLGKISQLPPVRSAVKRQYREREVYYADILEFDGRNVLFVFGCEGGTYVRKWIHDLGEKLGCGAHMEQLVRTKAGPFKYANCWTLQDIEDALWYYREQGNEKFLRHILQPVEDAIVHLPKIWVLDSTIDSMTHGQDLGIPGIAKITTGIERGDLVAVLSLKGELVSLSTAYLSTEEIRSREKGLAVKTDKVFIQEGVYPKYKKAESSVSSEQQLPKPATD